MRTVTAKSKVDSCGSESLNNTAEPTVEQAKHNACQSEGVANKTNVSIRSVGKEFLTDTVCDVTKEASNPNQFTLAITNNTTNNAGNIPGTLFENTTLDKCDKNTKDVRQALTHTTCETIGTKSADTGNAPNGKMYLIANYLTEATEDRTNENFAPKKMAEDTTKNTQEPQISPDPKYMGPEQPTPARRPNTPLI